jgi:hypothetical protein
VKGGINDCVKARDRVKGGASIGVAPWRGRGAARSPWHGGARGGGGATGSVREGGWGRGGHGLMGRLSLLGCSGPKGWMGRLTTRWIGPKVQENLFSDKNLIFEYTKALEICTRRFRRNLDTRIFPKFL